MQERSLTIAQHVVTESTSSKNDYKWKYNTRTDWRKQFIIQVTQKQRSVGDTYTFKPFGPPWLWRNENWQLHTEQSLQA